MGRIEYMNILQEGVTTWNAWRDTYQKLSPNLEGADLFYVDLRGFDLSRTNLSNANLHRANLDWADLHLADLSGAILEGACLNRSRLSQVNFFGADLSGASLECADLSAANLGEANFRKTTLRRAIFRQTFILDADFSEARLGGTIFSNVDLSSAKGMEKCHHSASSCVDHSTITKSKNVPQVFWRGCGLPDTLIDYLPSLSGDALQFYSCFISYSSKDHEFAKRLHADLQDNGVRCWFAPHDLQIGAKILDSVDEAIRLRDKVLLILSESAIASDWVEDEVTTAFEEERQRKEALLFPIRLDDAVMETGEAWAGKLRARNIGDFTRWKEHESYKATFERVLRDLRSEP